jgi:hypothetical protein
MSDLTPEDRDLLRGVRQRHEPTEADRGRIRAALVTSLGVGTGLTLTTAALPAAAGSSMVVKVLAAVAVAGALGGGGFAAYRVARTPHLISIAATGSRAPSPVAHEPRVAAPPEVPRELSPLPSSEAPTPSAAIVATPFRTTIPTTTPAAIKTTVPTPNAPRLPASIATPISTSTPSASPNPTPAAVLPIPTPPSATTVEAEMRLVGAAIDALHGGDPARALALFDEHARSFPNGVLAEERAGERVMALCDLDRVADARAAAADFLRAHAHAPLASRVRASCAGAATP